MANLGTTFLTSDMPSGGSYECLPAGWYTATINNAEIKATKSGTGRYIAVRYDITGPTHQGRVIYGNINIDNDNPKAEEIGRQQLRALMESVGLTKLTDTDQLIGGNVKIKLKIKNDAQYGDKNEVAGFASVTGSPPKIVSTDGPVAAPVSKASSAPPWAR
jgi:hypothetical protein